MVSRLVAVMNYDKLRTNAVQVMSKLHTSQRNRKSYGMWK